MCCTGHTNTDILTYKEKEVVVEHYFIICFITCFTNMNSLQLSIDREHKIDNFLVNVIKVKTTLVRKIRLNMIMIGTLMGIC